MEFFDQSEEIFIPKKKEKEFQQKFMQAKSCEAKMKLTLKLFDENNMMAKFNDVMKIAKKNKSVAANYRTTANNLFIRSNNTSVKTDWAKIILTYSKSIRFAPKESMDLSLAYAGRSAVLFKVRLYRDCLNDIERARKLVFPDNQKAELYARKAQCLTILEFPESEVTAAIEEAKKWLCKVDKSKKMIENIINNPITKDSFPKERVFLDGERNLPKIPDDNPEIVGASSAVEMKYTKEHGRHLVATRDIAPGEIISVQRCFASMVSLERTLELCFNCMKQTWSGIPCDSCVEVIYCSEECKQAAWLDHHNIECSIIDTISAFEARGYLAITIKLLIKGLKEVGEDAKTFKKYIESIKASPDERTKGFTDNVFDGQKFASFHSLLTFDEKRCYHEWKDVAITSAFVVHLLATKTNIFGKKFEGQLSQLKENDLAIFIGGLLMKQRQRISINAGISCEIPSNGDFENIKNIYCYYTYPLDKHFAQSCVSNISVSNCRNYSVMYCLDTIKKGEPIKDDNFCSFLKLPKLKRQEILKETYDVDCECQACRENWPMFQDLPVVTNGKKLSTDVVKKLQVELKNFTDKMAYYQKNKIYDHKPEDYLEAGKVISLLNEHCSFPTREKYYSVISLKSLFTVKGCHRQSFDDMAN